MRNDIIELMQKVFTFPVVSCVVPIFIISSVVGLFAKIIESVFMRSDYSISANSDYKYDLQQNVDADCSDELQNMWTCPYCDCLNKVIVLECPHCGAPKKGLP